MPLYEWTEKLSVSNVLIDEDHKHLIKLINNLFDAISVGKGATVLGETLDELVRYTESHFRREEVLMQEIAYRDYAHHKAEHDKLLEEVRAYQAKFASGVLVPPIDISNFLGSWLFKHIKACDVKLGESVGIFNLIKLR